MRVIGPLIGQLRLFRPRRIHRGDIDARLVAQHADPPDRSLVVGAGAGRQPDPVPVHRAEIGADRIDRTVAAGQALHHVVQRLERLAVVLHRPVAERHHIVPGLRLLLGRRGQQDLVADRGDEIHLHLDLVRLAPGLHLLAHDLVAGGYPVIPERDRDLAGSAGGTDVHQWQCSGGGRQRHSATASDAHERALPARSAPGAAARYGSAFAVSLIAALVAIPDFRASRVDRRPVIASRAKQSPSRNAP